MNRLFRIILLLSVALAAVIVVVLLCSLVLRRQGVRLQPSASSETGRVSRR